MPRCVPLARRTRYPGQAGKRDGWGGTPSENRVLDCRKTGRGFLKMFPSPSRVRRHMLFVRRQALRYIPEEEPGRSSSATEYARLFFALAGNGRECRSVELRALCNEVPRTPPGPEGSNGTGIASGAADHPKFLSSEDLSCWFLVFSRK
jgi:hypothetical protein